MFSLLRHSPKLTGAVLAFGLISAPALSGDYVVVDDFVFVPEKVTEGLQSRRSRFDTMLVRPGADLRNYSSVAIRSVVVKPRDKDFAKRLSAADRKQLTRDFRSQFGAGLGNRLATTNGKGTLVLSAAITHAWPNKDITGRYLTSRGGSSVGRSTSTGSGRASFEAVLKDGRTGKVVAVLADTYSGRPLTSNFNTNSRWGDARDGFRRWGRYLGKELGAPAGS